MLIAISKILNLIITASRRLSPLCLSYVMDLSPAKLYGYENAVYAALC